MGVNLEKCFNAIESLHVRREKMNVNRKIALLAVTAVAVIGSVLAASVAAANTGSTSSMRVAVDENRCFSKPTDWSHSWSGNVTIDSAQAKAVVQASIPSFKVGTPTLLRTSWQVPIEDGKGVVTSIEVSQASASTAEQAKSIVEESLKKGWKAGEPRLMRTTYNVPILDSNNATMGYVMVDGRSGEIIRRPSTTVTVTSEQAKAIVSDAVKAFEVGEVKDGGNAWMVSIKYKDKVVMTVLLGKLNTPTSGDAVKAVKDSMGKGWRAGEPKQLGFTYNVPIIDANSNAIGNIRVDGRTGNITAGFSPLRR